jgi:hypothetical protein
LRETTLAKKIVLKAFFDLEKERMLQIENLIPYYKLLSKDSKDLNGETLSYEKGFYPGISIGHYIPTYLYDKYYKFDCLSMNKSDCPSISMDVKDYDEP